MTKSLSKENKYKIQIMLLESDINVLFAGGFWKHGTREDAAHEIANYIIADIEQYKTLDQFLTLYQDVRYTLPERCTNLVFHAFNAILREVHSKFHVMPIPGIDQHTGELSLLQLAPKDIEYLDKSFASLTNIINPVSGKLYPVLQEHFGVIKK